MYKFPLHGQLLRRFSISSRNLAPHHHGHGSYAVPRQLLLLCILIVSFFTAVRAVRRLLANSYGSAIELILEFELSRGC